MNTPVHPKVFTNRTIRLLLPVIGTIGIAISIGISIAIGGVPLFLILVAASFAFLALAFPLEVWLYGLIAMILIIPEGTLLEKTFRVPGLPILWYEAFFFLLIARWFFRIATGRSSFPKSKYIVPLGLFAAVVSYATLRGLIEGRDLYWIASDVHVFAFYLLIPLTIQICREKENGLVEVSKRFTAVIVGSSAIGALVQIISYMSDNALVTIQSASDRVLSRNDEIFVFALILAIFASSSRLKWSKAYLVAGLLIASKLVLAFSRGAVLFLMEYWLVLVPIAYLLMRQRLSHSSAYLRRFSSWFVVLSIVAIVAVVITFGLDSPLSILDRFVSRISVDQQISNPIGLDFVQQRLYYWPQVMSYFSASPLLGSGMGTLFITERPELGVPFAQNVFIDNVFFTLLAKVGVVGLGLFLWVFALLTVGAYRVITKAKLDVVGFPLLFAFAVFVPLLWQDMFLSSMLTHFRVSAAVMVCIALLEVAQYQPSTRAIVSK